MFLAPKFCVCEKALVRTHTFGEQQKVRLKTVTNLKLGKGVLDKRNTSIFWIIYYIQREWSNMFMRALTKTRVCTLGT